ncbi:MAG: ParB/RepB/Spo0J family partition protein [Oscillospiraceae bacterium]|jgi:ParB family chromosome partitioning protein
MGLGKGLGALLGDAALHDTEGSVMLPLEQVEAAPDQPRRRFDEQKLNELADSIKLHGVIQPITVRRLSTGYYRIIAGERRWRAARIAGISEIPALVVDVDEQTATEMALIENLQREDLNPIEEAEGFRKLISRYGLTQEEAASRVGRSRSAVANSLRLLSLPEPILEELEAGDLTAGHARAILKLEGSVSQLRASRIIRERGLSVRQAETFCAKMAASEKKIRPKPAKPLEADYMGDLERELSACVGRRVRIVSGKRKGRLEIEYYGGDDLEALASALRKLNA